MEYILLTFRNVFTAFFNFCSSIELVDGVTITALLVAVFVLSMLFGKFGIKH